MAGEQLELIQSVCFTVSNSCLRLSGEEGEVRSALHEQSTALGLGMFALLVQRCTELLRDTPAGTHTVTSTSSCSVQVFIKAVALHSYPIQVLEIIVNISVRVFSSLSDEPLKEKNYCTVLQHISGDYS